VSAAVAGLREARFQHSPSFPEILARLGATLLISTYQAGELIAVGTGPDGLGFSFHRFDKAMGVAVGPRRIAVGAKGQIWFLNDSSQLAPMIEPPGRYDRCFIARGAAVTGQVQCHEVAWGSDERGEPELWFVNTRFSCLASLHPDYSFIPRWKPPFISELAAEDRCHLNGMAMRDGRPAFVTVMSETDHVGGWREDRNSTGCVLDVASGEPVATGLAMPHSPRWHEDRLLVLNSGRGTLEQVTPVSGERTVITSAPGFTRGLALYRNLAFVGLSRIRETAVFGGVPIAERHAELRCGVAVIDLDDGRTIASLEFETGIEEIFDLQLIPDARATMLSGDRPDGEDAQEIWVVPHDTDGAIPSPVRVRRSANALLAAGLTAQRQGRGPEAVTLLRQAAEAEPGSAEILNHLGNALQASQNPDGALAAYREAVGVDPAHAIARRNLGHLLVGQGLTDAGIAELTESQRIAPSDVNRMLLATAIPIIHTSSGEVRERRERLEAGVQGLVDEGFSLDTTSAPAPTTFYAAYHGVDDRALQANLGRIYRGPDLLSGRPVRRDGRPRIGFLSAYFTNHTIANLNLGRIQQLDRHRFEVLVLSGGANGDGMSEAFRQAADHFIELPRDVAGARSLVAEADLDVLVFTDVGMDATLSTLAFSRMAPVQCATWGHPVTTGSPCIDYFISSDLLEVPGADAHYTEELVRLPSLGTYYLRPRVLPADGVRSTLNVGPEQTVYACPQTLFKFHPDFDPLLAEILSRDRTGILVLLEGSNPRWAEQLRSRFARTLGDVGGRIVWLPALARDRYLQLLGAADVVLDPTHFGGGNSSYEALAMGSPVVTLPNELMRTRITRALYAKAGYEDLVVDSAQAYVELAVSLGTDADHRRQVRRRIVEVADVLFEDAGEIRHLEDFFAAAVQA
jgi:uncharacterized protein (TIGR03032 family)